MPGIIRTKTLMTIYKTIVSTYKCIWDKNVMQSVESLYNAKTFALNIWDCFLTQLSTARFRVNYFFIGAICSVMYTELLFTIAYR